MKTDMSREKEFIKNTFILSIGKFLPKLASFITLPILTGYLTKAEYGTIDYIATLIMLVIPIATLQIQTAAFRYLIDCRKDPIGISDIISTIITVTIPISLVASIVVSFFFSEFSVSIRVLVAVYFFLDTMHQTMGQITRGLGYNLYYSLSSILLSIAYTISVILFVFIAKKGLFGALLALSMAQLIGTLYLINKTKALHYYMLSRFSFSKVRELLVYSAPLVPNNLSAWVLKLSDRIVIKNFIGIEANAAYAVANKIPNLLAIAQNLIVMAWQENASIAVNDKDADKYYSSMLDHVYTLMFGCTTLLIAATPVIFKLFIRGNYEEAYYQMPVLILAMFFFVMSAFIGGIYAAHKKTVNVGISTMVAALINLTIDLCFVNIIGIWAGSISTLVAYIVLYLYRLIDCQRFQKLYVNVIKQITITVVMIIMLVLCFMRRIELNIINAAVGIGCFLYFNRDMITKTAKYCRSLFRNTR